MNRRVTGLLVCISLWIGAYASSVRILEQADDSVACRRWVDGQLARMTLKQKIGQLFIHTVAPITIQKNKDSLRSATRRPRRRAPHASHAPPPRLRPSVLSENPK